jgi:5'-methylthioinosine phosphorylase
LARELGLAYATCAVSANWAAGVNDEPITMDVIQNNLDQGMLAVKKVLQKVMALMSHGQN